MAIHSVFFSILDAKVEAESLEVQQLVNHTRSSLSADVDAARNQLSLRIDEHFRVTAASLTKLNATLLEETNQVDEALAVLNVTVVTEAAAVKTDVGVVKTTVETRADAIDAELVKLEVVFKNETLASEQRLQKVVEDKTAVLETRFDTLDSSVSSSNTTIHASLTALDDRLTQYITACNGTTV